MGRFLIWLSGARRQILDECPTERPKYIGIGASILITATMAAVSLAFALVTALRVELWLAMPFAIAWGLAILSLDRLFVVSLSREGRWPARVLRATPRVLLALLLGFVISTPFVLQIFRPEIEHEITILHTQAENAYLVGAKNSQLQQEINRYRSQVDKLTAAAGGGGPVIGGPQSAQLQSTLNQLNQAKTATDNDYNQWQCQLYGSAGGQTCRPAGNGPLATADQSRYEYDVAQVAQLASTAKLERNQLGQSIAGTQAKAKELLPAAQKALQAAEAEQARELSTFTTQNENNGGLLIRLQALDAVTSHDSILNAARWLLFLLFVVIDCMPVMIKVMLNLGPENNYDRLLEGEEEKQRDVAAVNRDFRKAAEMMAAGTLFGEAQSKLAGWSAAIAEVTQKIIATWKRVVDKKLGAWENTESPHLGGQEAARLGQITDVALLMGSTAMSLANAAPRRRWRYPARLQNLRSRARQLLSNARRPDKPQPQDAEASGQQPSTPTSPNKVQSVKSKHPGRERRDWLSTFIIPTVIAFATTAVTIYYTILQNGLADQQHQGDIAETYLSDMRDLLLNQHLSTSKPDSEVRQAAIEQTVTTLQRLNAQHNVTVLRFLRDASLIGPPNEVIDLSNADLSNADLSNADLSNAVMFSANLNHAQLSGAAFTGTSLSDAILTDADLSNARLGGAILSTADLTNADLAGADLEGADLAGAKITQPQLNEVHSCTYAILPAGLTCYRTPTISLTYWYTESKQETRVIINKLIPQFEHTYPLIHINAVPMDFFKTRAAFAAAVQDGNAPDVLRSDLGWTRLFASKGYLLNIDPYISQDNLDLTKYLHVALTYDGYNGHLYGLPQVTDVLALLYNKADIPFAPGTMHDFKTAATEVVQKKKAKYGFETDGALYNTLPFLLACGGEMLNQRNNTILVNDAGSVAGLQFLLNLESNPSHVMPSKKDFSKGSIDPVTDFMKGQTAMIFDGPWDVSRILTGRSFKDNHGNLGIARIPKGSAGQTRSPLGGQSYVISSGTEYPAEAYKFIEFMSSESSQVAIAEANHTLPTRHPAYRAGILSDPFTSVFSDIRFNSPVALRPTIPEAAYMFDVADPSTRAALAGRQSANEALNAIANSWNQLGAGNEVPQSASTRGTSQTACTSRT